MQAPNIIHRHIGGLESLFAPVALSHSIHRHIGGLENVKNCLQLIVDIHRHIGGLEIGYQSWDAY